MTTSADASKALPNSRSEYVAAAPPVVSRIILLLVIAAAAIAGFLVTSAGDTSSAVANAGAEFTRLLRAMAGLKMLMAAGLTAGVVWRLGAATTPAWLLAYGVACAAMAAGPGLIWDMVHVGTGAVLLHAGLLAGVMLLWRDPVVGKRLAAIVATRRVARLAR